MAGLHEDALYTGLKPFAPPKPALRFAEFGATNPFLLMMAGPGFSAFAKQRFPSGSAQGWKPFAWPSSADETTEAQAFSAGVGQSKDKTRNSAGLGKVWGRRTARNVTRTRSLPCKKQSEKKHAWILVAQSQVEALRRWRNGMDRLPLPV